MGNLVTYRNVSKEATKKEETAQLLGKGIESIFNNVSEKTAINGTKKAVQGVNEMRRSSTSPFNSFASLMIFFCGPHKSGDLPHVTWGIWKGLKYLFKQRRPRL